MRKHYSLKRLLIGLGLVGLLVGFFAGGAYAASGNPWSYQMNNAGKDGLVIQGVAGANSNVILAKDWADNPIFSVLQAGGAKVYGDCFGVTNGSDILHNQDTVCAAEPDPTYCVRTGQLWLGGAAGHLWRCESRYGGPLGWWELF